MALQALKFVLGPVATNTYLLFDDIDHQAVLIDPAIRSEKVVQIIREENLNLSGIWITHAHFDHFAGVSYFQSVMGYDVPIGLHPTDLSMWREGGGARVFGYHLPTQPEPNLFFEDGGRLIIGREAEIQIFSTPGHSQGHVVFYAPAIQSVFCGDLIFQGGIGRTDLPGGNLEALLESVQTKIFTLPPQTRLYCGHGPDTTVVDEVLDNPYFQ